MVPLWGHKTENIYTVSYSGVSLRELVVIKYSQLFRFNNVIGRNVIILHYSAKILVELSPIHQYPAYLYYLYIYSQPLQCVLISLQTIACTSTSLKYIECVSINWQERLHVMCFSIVLNIKEWMFVRVNGIWWLSKQQSHIWISCMVSIEWRWYNV